MTTAQHELAWQDRTVCWQYCRKAALAELHIVATQLLTFKAPGGQILDKDISIWRFASTALLSGELWQGG
jgi:hypothetical protein